MKTHSASKKRFKKSATGKIKRSKSYKRHHGWAKTTKQSRQLRGSTFVAACDAKGFNVLLPY